MGQLTRWEGLSPLRSTSALSSSATLEGIRFCLLRRPWTLLTLLPCLFPSSPFRSFPDTTTLSSNRLRRYRGFRYPEYILKVDRWLARSLVLQRASGRAEAKRPRPPRYLPSGINQLNARLLEASPSSPEPILPAFPRLPILFPPAPARPKGGPAIRPICRLLIQLVLPALPSAPPERIILASILLFDGARNAARLLSGPRIPRNLEITCFISVPVVSGDDGLPSPPCSRRG